MEKKIIKQTKLHIKKGDTVMVIAGNAKGKTGVIQEVITEKSRAIVEGANLQTKHVKPSASNPQGGIEKREGSIHISNLMVVENLSLIHISEPTRREWLSRMPSSA
jgi:large subunit ribosomal protein L24